MGVNYGTFKPTMKLPKPVRLQGRNMAQSEFYDDLAYRPQEDGNPFRSIPNAEEGDFQPQELGEEQQQRQIPTGDYIRAQLGGLKERTVRPELNPQDRVRNPSEALVDPTGFQTYYNMMESISQRSQEALRKEEVKSSNRQQSKLAEILSRQLPQFNSPTLDYTGPGLRKFSPSQISHIRNLPAGKNRNFGYAQALAPRYNWGPQQLNAWYELGMKESGWNNNAQNPTSTAYGIGQFLDSTWGAYGFRKTSDPGAQVNAMAEYIRKRYGTPLNALRFHYANNWY